MGGLPFFVGYSILGLCLFYDISYFRNFQQSIVTLLTMMYGNMVYEVSFYAGENLICKV